MVKLLVVFGTRPEAIKMAPVIKALEQSGADVRICVTGQHREMLDQVLDLFAITPDIDLEVMTPGQSLTHLTTRIMEGVAQVVRDYQPDWVLVHGDTTTAFAAALAAFHQRIPVAHVEAGLRTGDLHSPWPEEANRKLVGSLAALHFAPTTTARDNLLRENIAAEKIHVTGNTVIDALQLARPRLAAASLPAFLRPEAKLVLITGHRRENFGSGFERICQAITQLAQKHPEVDFIYPLHLNPAVRLPVEKQLGALPHVHLLPPQDYFPFLQLMQHATFILTDSGGIQEEAPAFGKPVLLLRDTTERPEAVEAGTVKLVGTDVARITTAARQLLTDQIEYQRMARTANPFGDGKASARILAALGITAATEAPFA